MIGLIPVLNIPMYFLFAVREHYFGNGLRKGIFYTSRYSDVALANHSFLKKLSFWNTAFLTKLIPCMLMAVCSLALLYKLIRAQRQRQKLRWRISNQTTAKNVIHNPGSVRSAAGGTLSSNSNSNPYHTDRTTRMLLVILLMFVSSELPTGITILLMGIYGSRFQNNVNAPLWEVLEIMALFTSGVNFILLVSMSRKFRQTFCVIFLHRGRSDTHVPERSSHTLANVR